MDFEQQKPITNEFRKGWERIYAQREARKEKSVGSAETYKNGCPILSDGPMRDDL